MSFDDHDRCRRCGADDTASHTLTECDRILRERAEAQRRHDAAHGAARCGYAGVCAWMRAAVGGDRGGALFFERREMPHPDTLRNVVRYVVTLHSETRVARACPACGGNPNEAAPVMR